MQMQLTITTQEPNTCFLRIGSEDTACGLAWEDPRVEQATGNRGLTTCPACLREIDRRPWIAMESDPVVVAVFDVCRKAQAVGLVDTGATVIRSLTVAGVRVLAALLLVGGLTGCPAPASCPDGAAPCDQVGGAPLATVDGCCWVD